MIGELPDAGAHLRTLEIWLPLAQQLNQELGWGLAPPEVESLILACAAELRTAESLMIASAVLWRQQLYLSSAVV